MKGTLLVLAGVALLGAPIALAEEGPQSAPNPQQVAAGKALYDSKGCARCHQIDGQGNRMSVLDGVGDKLSADEIKLWLTNPDEAAAKLERRPVMKMPKVALEAAEVDALVAYLRTLKKS